MTQENEKRPDRPGMKYWDMICALPSYGFLLAPEGNRVIKAEGVGNWIDQHEAQKVVDQAQEEINDLRARLAQPGFGHAVPTGADRASRIYVAGPMTGIEDYNFPAFNAAAAALRAQGWQVENPAEHALVDNLEWADYMAYDLTRLGLCGAIHLLPGWSKSKGAMIEWNIARSLGMKVQFATGADQGEVGVYPQEVL